MASIQKTAKGYRAQVAILGTRDSKTFATRREAVDWANRREIELREVKDKDPGLRHTLREALRKYAEEVTPNKRGARWEEVRLAAFEGYLLPLDSPIGKVTPEHMALFRDFRLRSVGTASVRRELSILSAMFETARKEWGWVRGNPCSDISKPQIKRHRERLISWREVKAMLRAMNYSKRRRVASTTQAVAVCFLAALRTINAASQEQSAGVGQIGLAVSQMDRVTQQNAALVEEMSAAANSLMEQAHDLVNAVAVFKLSGQGRQEGVVIDIEPSMLRLSA